METEDKKYIQIELDPKLKRKVKVLSAASGKTLREIVTELLIKHLEEKEL